MDAYVVGPGLRGQEQIVPLAVTFNLDDAKQFAKDRWGVEVHEVEGRPGMWTGRREPENPVDLVFVFLVPMTGAQS